MYLQSLEIQGFKSFANKTVLNFHRGVTAIVGPNGCGKSNVLDAVRWVLGEQSAKALRGGEMADVIFSGTDSKQALGMAEVSLTFSECEEQLGVDWKEVRVTRRVFRDGKSDYLLNKAPCRLKDIHQLFMDTGIGRSAYSIMEQGKIDQILSSRPEDRRSIFEEAAGITKFKAQRKEALRKLEATEGNLLRVTDIIREVKRQIGSLQRQAGKARRYQSLIADLKTLETHFSHHQFVQLDTALQKATAEISTLLAVQQQQEESIEREENVLSDRRHGLEAMEEQLMDARQLVQELRNQMAVAENRIGFNLERTKEFAGLIERYERDIAGSGEKQKFQEQQIQSTNLEIQGLEGSLQVEQRRLQEKTAAASEVTRQRRSVENQLQSIGSRILQLDSQISRLRSQISSIISQRDGNETRIGILESEITQLQETKAEREELLNGVRASVEASAQRLSDCERDQRSAEAGERGLRGTLSEAESVLNTERRRLSEKESRLEVLRQMVESGEGLEAGTQAVLKGLDNPDFFKPAVSGALAGGIQVEEAFIPAVEAALGQNLQAILIKDTMVGESVIKTLAAKKLGRASLALREFLATEPATNQMALPEGAICWAIEKVSSSGEAQILATHLLRNAVMVEDLETALRLKASSPRELSFVTLAGETISSAGIVQGGKSGKANTSVLQRKNQILALEEEEKALLGSVAEKEQQRDEVAAELEEVRTRLQEMREETQQIKIETSTFKNQLALLEREARETDRKLENLGLEKDNIGKRYREAVEKIEQLEAEVSGLTSQSGEMKAQQEVQVAEVESLRETESVISAEANELRLQVATEKQRYDSLRNQRQPMAARLAELGELIAQRQRDVVGYQEKIAGLQSEIGELESGIEITRSETGEAEHSVSRIMEERATMNAAVEELDTELRHLRRQLADVQERKGKEEVRQTQLQLRIESVSEHINRRYQLDLRAFQPDRGELAEAISDQLKRNRNVAADVRKQENSTDVADAAPDGEQESETTPAIAIDWETVEALVREMDQRVESMGPVNIDAIQEYEELEQRYAFLEEQFDDLTRSKAELLDVIAKINQTTKKLFAETFEQVRKNFQEMFTELFGGGKANLMLLDESDPLESGIDIIAKPPGKQLQSITLLSGGEKTMTAVAMLFAIYMVKPSPFCVLDEMDAPLDESNINRFIKILDRFVSQSQFVVITHNKRTISKADILYGVTMEEHGISKLVGVRLSRREDSTEDTDVIGTQNPVPVPSIAETFGKSGELNSETEQKVG
jgi:chromosome segregation protein